jgi:hypothetical protein
MVKSNQKTRLKMWVGFCWSIIAVLQLTSCSSKHEFLTSTVVPAARGYVKVKKDGNQNYAIHLNVDYLAETDRLNPPRETYVVWLETKQEESKNIGQIHNTKHSEAKNLKASFETVSVFEPVRIYITAEDDAAVSYPNTPIILSTGKIKT